MRGKRSVMTGAAILGVLGALAVAQSQFQRAAAAQSKRWAAQRRMRKRGRSNRGKTE